jgi:hypothetical protein
MILATNKFEGDHAIFIHFANAFFLQTYYAMVKSGQHLSQKTQLIFH